jgi:hypothetical protein
MYARVRGCAWGCVGELVRVRDCSRVSEWMEWTGERVWQVEGRVGERVWQVDVRGWEEGVAGIMVGD